MDRVNIVKAVSKNIDGYAHSSAGLTYQECLECVINDYKLLIELLTSSEIISDTSLIVDECNKCLAYANELNNSTENDGDWMITLFEEESRLGLV